MQNAAEGRATLVAFDHAYHAGKASIQLTERKLLQAKLRL